MKRRVVKLLNGGAGIDPQVLAMLLTQERNGLVQIVHVRAVEPPEVEQPSLFEVAARQALHEATAATERAAVLRGAARASVEAKASEAYRSAGYWSKLARPEAVA